MSIDKEGIDKECLNEAIKDYLKENLTLTVDTSEDYVGDMGGGSSLYKTSHVLHLWLDGVLFLQCTWTDRSPQATK